MTSHQSRDAQDYNYKHNTDDAIYIYKGFNNVINIDVKKISEYSAS